MNKRGEPRVAHQIRFFVHVHECKEDPDLIGLSVECEAIDFSTRGMQFKTDSKLHPRSIVKITIGVGEPFAMYELEGEIRWVRNEGDDYSMGVLLQENANTDYQKWETDFKSTFA
tara:strand:- start:7707 stop:8051 length:345 start_codon:yes stop_codon:yes gene_type:complete